MTIDLSNIERWPDTITLDLGIVATTNRNGSSKEHRLTVELHLMGLLRWGMEAQKSTRKLRAGMNGIVIAKAEEVSGTVVI